jgi:hypothetical protein
MRGIYYYCNPSKHLIMKISIQELEQNLTRNLILKLAQKEDEFLINQLKLVTPKIKGQITKGKLQWRGIKLIEINDFDGTTKWIEQRGKQIGERLRLEYNLIINQNI